MKIVAKTQTGKQIQVQVDANDIIYRIKEKIEQKEGIPADQQKLIKENPAKMLNDYSTLQEEGVVEGESIKLILNLIGD